MSLAPLALALALLAPAPASPPENLAAELTDHVGVLSEETRTQVTQAQDRLAREDGLQLFVVVVDDFDGLTPQDWVARTASLSGLGEQDLAVAVAEDSREKAVHVPAGGRLRAATVEQVTTRADALLAEGETEAAVTELVDGLATAPRDLPRDAWQIGTWVLGGLLAVLTAGALTWWLLGRSRRARAEATTLDEARRLARDLGRTTLELDEQLRRAELETEFAAAEFDPPLIASLTETVAAGRGSALEAHRRRDAILTGPTDDPTWRVGADEALRELREIEASSQAALERVRRLPAMLTQLREQSDLVPTRIKGLRSLAARADLPAPTAEQVRSLLARAEQDVAAQRPEAALLPLRTVVALLGHDDTGAVSASGNAAAPPPDRSAPGR